MEFFTIVLSSLLGLIIPAGLVIERTAANAIRSQFARVEQLQVRIDNVPSYQLLQGKVGRVRIAGRSLQLKRQNIHIAVLELETDPIELASLSFKQKRPKIIRPLQAVVRVVLTPQDINQLLQSPQLIVGLRQLNLRSVSSLNIGNDPGYKIHFRDVSFVANNRLLFHVELQHSGKGKPLLIRVESGLVLVDGRRIQLVDPVVAVDGEEVPPRLIKLVVMDVNKRLDLHNLEGDGLQIRILKLSMKPAELEIAAFFRIEPSSRFLETLGS